MCIGPPYAGGAGSCGNGTSGGTPTFGANPDLGTPTGAPLPSGSYPPGYDPKMVDGDPGGYPIQDQPGVIKEGPGVMVAEAMEEARKKAGWICEEGKKCRRPGTKMMMKRGPVKALGRSRRLG